MPLTIDEVMKNHEIAFLPEKAEGVEAVIQFIFSGEQSGDYIVAIKEGACTVEQGQHENPRMTLECEGQLYMDVVTGKADAMQSFMQGKIKLAGDLNVAMKLTSMFKLS